MAECCLKTGKEFLLPAGENDSTYLFRKVLRKRRNEGFVKFFQAFAREGAYSQDSAGVAGGKVFRLQGTCKVNFVNDGDGLLRIKFSEEIKFVAGKRSRTVEYEKSEGSLAKNLACPSHPFQFHPLSRRGKSSGIHEFDGMSSQDHFRDDEVARGARLILND